ncbi:hypothetical protein SO802_018485 [Lithocarpus litseifolius]|uniref:Small ribosomal subunit protein mS29 n=1 Tax=Lithocarpus litseifolius TaxID=425828 RepID=A0AAW2CN96_9ROSI
MVNAFRSMMQDDMMVGAFSHSTAVGKLCKDLPDVPEDARVNFPHYTLDEAASVCHYYLRQRLVQHEVFSEKNWKKVYYLANGNGSEMRGVGSFHATIDIIYSPFDPCYRCASTEAHVLFSLPLVLISLMKINEILPSLDSYPNATTKVASSITPVTFWLRSSFLMELASKDNVPYIDHIAFCSFDLRNSFIFFCKKFLFS